jgi:hypothetical protein
VGLPALISYADGSEELYQLSQQPSWDKSRRNSTLLAMLLHIRRHQKAELPQIVLISGGSAACLGFGKHWKQDGGRDADDGDDNEKLKRRKCGGIQAAYHSPCFHFQCRPQSEWVAALTISRPSSFVRRPASTKRLTTLATATT